METGELMLGDRLLEIELAVRIGVSPKPIREAIRRLEAEGIVTHSPRVGAMVRTLGQQEIAEFNEMGIVFETTAARMAAKHASDADICTLVDLNEDLAENAGNAVKVAILKRPFHHWTMQATRIWKTRWIID